MTNAELEARIQANPEDREAYLVYADWLSERGDPRGELITVQAKLEDNPADGALRDREQSLLAAHRETWLGELAKLDPKQDLAVTWRWGFMRAVRVGPPTSEYDTSEIDFPDTIRTLLRLPGARFLRELVIGAISYDDYPTSWSGCIEALAESDVPATLRRLEFTRGGYWDISSTELGDLSPLYPKLGKLEELRIELGAMELGAIELPALEKLEIETGGLTSENMKSINTARWPALGSLLLCIGETGNDYGCTVELADIEPLFAAENLPRVKHLALANSSLADDIAAGLVGSRILPRLATLALDKGTMTDAGARAILDNWDHFKHLERLDLSHGYFSDDVVDELKARTGPTIVLDDLQDADDEYRYCEISE